MKETILLIEDDKIIARFVKFKLDKEGYTVIHYDNGIEGIKAIEELQPDLVIMDMMMPGIDGREVVEQVSEKNLIDTNKIIILSGKEENEEVEALFELGIHDYLQKPIDIENLMIRIKRALSALSDET